MNPGGLRFEEPGEVATSRVSLLVGAAVLFATSLVLGQLGAPGWGAFVEQGLAVWLLGAFAWRAYRATAKGVVHADSLGLRLGDTTVAERSRIAAAFLLSPESPVVRIVLRRALSIDVRLESEEKARALLTALGLGIGESIATFSALQRGRWTRVSVGLVLVGSAVIAMATIDLLHRWDLAAAARLALFGFGTLGLYVRLSTRVDVGSDGVLLLRLGQQRFVSYRALRSALPIGPNGILLDMRGGANVGLTLGGWGDRAQLRDALVQRIEEARSAFAEGEGIATSEALVAPGGRAPQRWLREIRALATARDSRETRLDEERLWRVVDDATAPAGMRAGAAMALSALDQASRTRLRVSAEACAEPKLRVALTRVADGATDAELEEALTPLLESKS